MENVLQEIKNDLVEINQIKKPLLTNQDKLKIRDYENQLRSVTQELNDIKTEIL